MHASRALRSFLLFLPAVAIAAGCVAQTEDTASQGEPLGVGPLPVPTGIGIGLPNPPSSPGAFEITPYAAYVSLRWISPDSTMNEWVVWRRNMQGAWVQAHEVASNTPGASYVWEDAAGGLSAQCYRVSAISTVTGLGSNSPEQCTVRPNPSVFPQVPAAGTVEWQGLSIRSDGLGFLNPTDGDYYLQTWDQTFGVNLNLATFTGNNVRPERQGGATSTTPLMFGEKFAIRVAGAGWLAYGNQTWGVNLVLSPTPSYEWYVLGDEKPGQPLDTGPMALWSSVASDFLVTHSRWWGVNLDWWKNTQPSPPAQPTPPPGTKTLEVFNCAPDGSAVDMYLADETAGGGEWIYQATLAAQYGAAGCPVGATPWTFSPTTGHTYAFEAVSTTVDNGVDCDGHPEISSCARLSTTFIGDSTSGQLNVQEVGN